MRLELKNHLYFGLGYSFFVKGFLMCEVGTKESYLEIEKVVKEGCFALFLMCCHPEKNLRVQIKQAIDCI